MRKHSTLLYGRTALGLKIKLLLKLSVCDSISHQGDCMIHFSQKKQDVVKNELNVISTVNCFERSSVCSVHLIPQPGYFQICEDSHQDSICEFPAFTSVLSGMFDHLYLQMCVEAGRKPTDCE